MSVHGRLPEAETTTARQSVLVLAGLVVLGAAGFFATMTVAYYGWATTVLGFGYDEDLVVVWVLLSATCVPLAAMAAWWGIRRSSIWWSSCCWSASCRGTPAPDSGVLLLAPMTWLAGIGLGLLSALGV